MTSELIALVNRREIGRVHRNKQGRLSFVYDDDWRNAKGAYPLSVSMPVAAAKHGHAVIDGFPVGVAARQ